MKTKSRQQAFRNIAAENIRIAMKSAGITQVQLAKKTAVAQSTISAVLNAKFDARTSLMVKLAEILGLSFAEALGVKSLKNEPPIKFKPAVDKKKRTRYRSHPNRVG